ncbi:MAG TPA: hypothetical protein VIV40_25275, partial [Kofleriaceae bacterium]
MTRIAALLVVFCACDRKASESKPEPTPPVPPGPTQVSDAAAAIDAASVAVDAAPAGIVLTFDQDEVGGPAAGVEPVIGDWRIGEADKARGLLVDGSRWRNGTPSANLADQAKKLYGDHYAEFLDGVKAFAFYPLALVEQQPPSGDIKMSIRFYPIAGRIDQGAGIAFDAHPDGSYWGVRANALENNILFFHVVKGRRTVFDNIRNTPTPTKTWHTLVA